MNKQDIRQLMLEKRKSYTKTEIYSKSDILTNKLFEKYDFNKINTLHIYLSIDENNEVDTWDIMNNIFENYKTEIIVPKVNGDKLDHYYLNKNTILTKNKYNILEPKDAKPYISNSFDMIIVPLLCVNKDYHRIGYGNGYYDKFLSEYSGLKIGLSFENPIDFKVEKHDVRLDNCLFVN